MSLMQKGIFPNMPAAEYHADKTFIGSSTLVKKAKSAKHFMDAWTNPEDPTKAQDRGTFFHDLLLEQNVSKYVPRPVKDGRLVATNTDAYKKFLAENEGKTPVHPDDYKDMNEMLTSFCENKKAMHMMKNAQIEASIFTKDPETEIFIKMRADIWGHGYINDLKSCADLTKFHNQIFSLNYDVRIVHYANCVFFHTGERIDNLYFTAFESKAPYWSENYCLSSGDRSAAEDKWRIWMNEIAVCMKDNRWPGPSDTIKMTKRPAYLIDDEISFEGAG